jgi:NADH-quinone oxidoreductase subunit C
MLSLEPIRDQILRAVPGATVELITNPGPSGQHSLLISHPHATAVAQFLRDDPELRMDFCSNVTGVDWLEQTVREKVTVREEVDGEEKEVEKQVERVIPGYLEAVYHLYSMAHKHGPVILRLRTGNRTDQVDLPSLTPVWRSAEFQEREIFDLYGIRFTGHPDLRRLLMWDEFEGHPMRKDYQPPEDDEEREPFTPARRSES